MRGLTPPVGTLAGLLVGLWLLAPVALGAAVLVWRLLGWLVRSRRDRRHPERVAVRDQQRQARRLVAEWPLLAQTLRLGYTDQWTRQFRFPAAAFAVDGQAVTATVAAIAGASLADYQRAATYLADTWGCVAVRAEQRGPGLVRLRGLVRDPLLAPAQAELSGQAPASLDAWWLGWAEDARPVLVRLAEVSGMVVAGLAGFGKTMLVAHLLGQLAPSPAVQLVLIDGKGGPDYDQLVPRAWLSAKDDLDQVREVLRRVHRLMADRQAAIARVLGVTDAWHPGPSPEWPLVLVIIDEAHTFFHERKGTAAEVKAHNALVAETARLVEELVRKGRNVAVQVLLLSGWTRSCRMPGSSCPAWPPTSLGSPAGRCWKPSSPAPTTRRCWPPWPRAGSGASCQRCGRPWPAGSAPTIMGCWSPRSWPTSTTWTRPSPRSLRGSSR
jgi:hypothetical protein